MSLYKGLKILGYNPYHMVEVCIGGLDHFRMFHEYIHLSQEQSDVGKPYGRREFDKWFQGFDVGLISFSHNACSGGCTNGGSRQYARYQAILEGCLLWMPISMTPMSCSS